VTVFRAWTTLLLVSALFFVITAATFASLGVALPAMMAEMKWNYGEAGAGFSLLAVLCGVTATIPVTLIRRFSVRVNFLCGAAVMALAFALLAHAGSLTIYYAGAALAGCGFTLLDTVPGTYLLTRLFPRPAFAFGLYFTIGGLGGVAGPPLYHLIAGPGDNWRAFWIACGALVVAVAVVAALFCDTSSDVARQGEADPAITSSGWTAQAAIRTWPFVFLAAAYATFLICDITVNAASVLHLTQRGVDAQMAGWLISLWALLNAGSRLAGGLLNAFVSARTLLIAALAMLAVGMAALALGQGTAMLAVYAICIGIGSGLCFFASTILLLDYFGRAPNLQLFALVNLISTVGSAAPWAAGVTRDVSGSYTAFFLVVAAAMAVMTLLAVLLKRPVPR
jgi:MFS family permease